MSYIPQIAQKPSSNPQIRLGIIGASHTGKTTFASTFPNPIYADFDGNLSAFSGRSDILVLPFTDVEWCKSLVGRAPDDIKNIPHFAFKKWLTSGDAMKLEPDQTLVLDSWTSLQDAFDQQMVLNPPKTATGALDPYEPWALKIDYSQSVMVTLKQLRCNVIVIFHEQDQKDQNGCIVGKIEPLMQGKFVKKLGLYFTDFFRCVTRSKYKKGPDGKDVHEGTIYEVQTGSSTDINLGSRTVPSGLPTYMKPEYATFASYFPQNKKV